MRIAVAVLSVAVAAGCASRAKVVVSSPADCMAAIGALDLDPEHYRSYQAYHDTLTRSMIAWLKAMRDPTQLKDLFYQCQTKIESTPESPQDELQWVNPYFECQMLIMLRLSELKSEEAARTMVDLYLDRRVCWDAHRGETGAEAILRCREFSVPVLKEKMKAGVDVRWLMELAESGAQGTP